MASQETGRIADQLRRAYAGEAWHGPSLRENLEGVSASAAASRPIEGAHSIWELVLHLTAWIRLTKEVMDGARYVSLAGDADWPPVGATDEAAWLSTLENLERAEKALEDAVKQFPEDRLSEQIPGREFKFYVLLHGVVQHNLYHAGQIALLRKIHA